MIRPLILASASRSRSAMLTAAGVDFRAVPADVDEAALKRDMSTGEPGEVALALALAKARKVSADVPGALVIGADQMLECEGRWFDKPVDSPAARRQLLALRGRSHQLICAVVAVCDGDSLWQHREDARLVMRPFSEAFLDAYLEGAGPAVLGSVGAYQLEGTGAQLFDFIAGDFFTILGMPLLPLLAFLRREGNLTP